MIGARAVDDQNPRTVADCHGHSHVPLDRTEQLVHLEVSSRSDPPVIQQQTPAARAEGSERARDSVVEILRRKEIDGQVVQSLDLAPPRFCFDCAAPRARHQLARDDRGDEERA